MIKTTKAGRNVTVRVTFALPADEPRGAVSVVGDFNDWDPFAHPMRRRANGTRSAAVTVRPGATLRFRYLAEGGVWFDDETAPPGTARTPASRSDPGREQFARRPFSIGPARTCESRVPPPGGHSFVGGVLRRAGGSCP